MLKQYLHQGVALGIIESVPVGTPTILCSRTVVAHKKDGPPHARTHGTSITVYRVPQPQEMPLHLSLNGAGTDVFVLLRDFIRLETDMPVGSTMLQYTFFEKKTVS